MKIEFNIDRTTLESIEGTIEANGFGQAFNIIPARSVQLFKDLFDSSYNAAISSVTTEIATINQNASNLYDYIAGVSTNLTTNYLSQASATTQLGELESSVQEQYATYVGDQLGGIYSLQIVNDVNGTEYVSGFQMGALTEPLTGSTDSFFRINADKFIVGGDIGDGFKSPVNELGEPLPAFVIDQSDGAVPQIYFNGKVIFSNVTDDTGTTIIDGGKIKTDFIDAQAVYTDMLTVGTRSIPYTFPPSIGIPDLATYGLSEFINGDNYYNTTDEMLYTYAGDEWVSSNPTISVLGIAFTRSKTKPDTPTGGTYDNPTPDGWEDGIPESDDTKSIQDAVWWSHYRFDNKTDYSAADFPVWAEPEKVTDVAGVVDFVYNENETDPGNPPSYTGDLMSLTDAAANGNTDAQTDIANGWKDNYSTSTVWGARRAYDSTTGTWGAWAYSRIKGEDGKTSDFKSYIFKRSATKPTDYPDTADLSGVNNGWTDGVSAGTDILWTRIADMTYTSVDIYTFKSGTWADTEVIQVEGKDGDSATLRVIWNDSLTLPVSPSNALLKSTQLVGTTTSATGADGWYDEASENAVWSAYATYDSNNDTENNDPTDSNTGWTNWTVIRVKGEKGEDALPGNFTKNIFKRSATKPSDQPTAAVFVDGLNEWYDGVPPGSDTLWVCLAEMYYTNATTYTFVDSDTKWGESIQLEGKDGDAAGLKTVWSATTSTAPVQYTGTWVDTTDWHDVGTVSDIWAAYSTLNGGAWSAWDVVKVKGEKGDAGQDVNFIFRIHTSATVAPSLTGTAVLPTGWSDSVINTTSANPYRWSSKGTSIDGGTTWVWGTPILETATNLAELKLYKLNDTTMSTAGSYNFATAVLSGFETGWTTYPPSLVNNGDKVYVTSALVSGSSTSVVTPSWSTPVVYASRVDGEDGSRGTAVLTYNGISSAFDSDIASGLFSGGPIAGDQVIWATSYAGGTRIYKFNGTTWGDDTSLYIDGSVIITGTIGVDKISSGVVNLSATQSFELGATLDGVIKAKTTSGSVNGAISAESYGGASNPPTIAATNYSTGRALYGYSWSGTGVYGFSTTGYAGDFNGKIKVAGNLTVSTGYSMTLGGYSLSSFSGEALATQLSTNYVQNATNATFLDAGRLEFYWDDAGSGSLKLLVDNTTTFTVTTT